MVLCTLKYGKRLDFILGILIQVSKKLREGEEKKEYKEVFEKHSSG